MGVVNIKISKFGGLTRARQARDLCVSLGIAMTLEDTWGGGVVTAAIAHWPTTRRQNLFTSTDFNSHVTRSIAHGPQRKERSTRRFPNSGTRHRTDGGDPFRRTGIGRRLKDFIPCLIPKGIGSKDEQTLVLSLRLNCLLDP